MITLWAETSNVIWVTVIPSDACFLTITYDYSNNINNYFPHNLWQRVDISPIARVGVTFNIQLDWSLHNNLVGASSWVSYILSSNGSLSPASGDWSNIATSIGPDDQAGSLSITISDNDYLYIQVRAYAAPGFTGLLSSAHCTLADGGSLTPCVGTVEASGSPLVFSATASS